MNTRKNILVNLLGGPGSGKSTVAAELFVHYKKKGINTELVREYAKELIWANRLENVSNYHITVEQFRRQRMLYDKVDLIITDGSAIGGLIHEKYYEGTDTCSELMASYYHYDIKKFNIKEFNFLLSRENKYEQWGRFQTESEVICFENFYDDFLFKYAKINHLIKTNSVERIISIINEELEK